MMDAHPGLRALVYIRHVAMMRKRLTASPIMITGTRAAMETSVSS
jgi:hypothetical protein